MVTLLMMSTNAVAGPAEARSRLRWPFVVVGLVVAIFATAVLYMISGHARTYGPTMLTPRHTLRVFDVGTRIADEHAAVRHLDRAQRFGV